jgi:hypothetical protein
MPAQPRFDHPTLREQVLAEEKAREDATTVRRIILLLCALVAVIVLLVGAINYKSHDTVATEHSPPDTTRQLPPDATGEVAGAASVVQTFDDLPIRSRLADPWTTAGDGSAEVVALPTSVDRSLRISSSTTGKPTLVCRPMSVGPAQSFTIAFDYLVGRPPASAATILRLQSESSSQLELGIDTMARPFIGAGPGGTGPAPAIGSPPPAAASARAVAAGWARVEIKVDVAAGTAQWLAHDTSGAQIGSGTAALARAVDAPVDKVCLLSPAGSPAAWVAIDNLVIEA